LGVVVLVEGDERRVRLRLLVDVDVERPVRERDRLRERRRAAGGRRGGCRLLAASAGGEEAGDAQQRPAGEGRRVSTCQSSGVSSDRGTTKVACGENEISR